MLNIEYSGQFKKDLKLANKRGKDFKKIKEVMRLLISEKPLTRQYLDHPLSGNWKGYRDLHIESDWLLIYHLEAKTIRFERTGTHLDLF